MSKVQAFDKGISPPNFSWIMKGKLAAMGWPKSIENIHFIVNQNIKHLITLSPERIPPIESTNDLDWTEIPVEEFEAPTIHQIKQFIRICETCFSKGQAVGVHCRQGSGRTGVMAACFLVYFEGSTAQRAITNIRLQRPASIEVFQQEKIVEEYHDFLRKTC